VNSRNIVLETAHFGVSQVVSSPVVAASIRTCRSDVRRLGAVADVNPVVAVIPARNAEATLPAALASVCAQSVRPDHTIVVDDGSMDRTGDAARSFSRHLSMEVRAHPRPLGVSAAFRTALEDAGGARFARLDADDVWLPDHLETLVDSHVAGEVVSADAITWTPGRALSARSWFQRYPLPPPNRQLSVLVRRNIILSAGLMEVDLFLRHGGYRDLDSVEDWDLWLRMANSGVIFRAAAHPTMLYRQSPATRSKGAAAATATAAMLDEFSNEVDDVALRRRAKQTARDWQGRASLFEAQVQARVGHRRLARLKAARATRLGRPRTKARSLATVVAPVGATRAYDRIVGAGQRRGLQ
jgi:hypothetical protein